MDPTNERITTKLFVGCVLTSEIKMLLSQNAAWKESQLTGQTLQEIRYHEKDYIGTLLPSPEIPLEEIRNVEKCILNQLEQYCPELDVSRMSAVVIPQVYLS